MRKANQGNFRFCTDEILKIACRTRKKNYNREPRLSERNNLYPRCCNKTQIRCTLFGRGDVCNKQSNISET